MYSLERTIGDNEGAGYELDYIPIMDLVWGKGFIAPGGEGNVDRIVEGVDLQGKRVLELGSGAGGGTLGLTGYILMNYIIDSSEIVHLIRGRR